MIITARHNDYTFVDWVKLIGLQMYSIIAKDERKLIKGYMSLSGALLGVLLQDDDGYILVLNKGEHKLKELGPFKHQAEADGTAAMLLGEDVIEKAGSLILEEVKRKP